MRLVTYRRDVCAAARLGALVETTVVDLALLAASVATALRGHSGTSGDWWAAAADIAHLTGVALWIGALTQVVAATIRAHGQGTPVIDQVRRYSRLALPSSLSFS